MNRAENEQKGGELQTYPPKPAWLSVAVLAADAGSAGDVITQLDKSEHKHMDRQTKECVSAHNINTDHFTKNLDSIRIVGLCTMLLQQTRKTDGDSPDLQSLLCSVVVA